MHSRVPVSGPRVQPNRREVAPVDAIREVLCLQAEAVMLIVPCAITPHQPVKVVARILPECDATSSRWHHGAQAKPSQAKPSQATEGTEGSGAIR